jgi:hypothetical protein
VGVEVGGAVGVDVGVVTGVAVGVDIGGSVAVAVGAALGVGDTPARAGVGNAKDIPDTGRPQNKFPGRLTTEASPSTLQPNGPDQIKHLRSVYGSRVSPNLFAEGACLF